SGRSCGSVYYLAQIVIEYNNMDTNTKREVENFVSHLQNPVIFPGLLQLNINSYIRTLQKKANIKQVTAYNLFKKRVTEESRLINMTDGKVIGLSTNIVWRNMTSAQKNVFVIFSSQIRSRIGN
ncbi:37543_t:CDS:2, partial [Gigaspora margarita]